MPACKNCRWLDHETMRCDLNQHTSVDHPGWHKNEMRACHTAILLKYNEVWEGDLLEIGHGVSRMARKLCAHNERVTWHGIDPRWPDNLEARHWGVGVADMHCFEDNRFDWCVAMETIEHWYEYGETFEDGLSEIHRVLKPGGKLVLTAPFFVHGHDLFYFGKVNEVKELFNTPLWDSVAFEPWRRDYEGRPPIRGWEWQRQRMALQKRYKKRGEELVKMYGYEPVTWKMEVLATKK